MYIIKNVNLKHRVDYKRTERLGSMIDRTLHILEVAGGPGAFARIKYAIPVYESFVYN
jgi:hypothetical protein